MNRKKIIIIAVSILVILGVVLISVLVKHNSTPVKQEPERGGTPQIVLINGDKLYNIVLPNQYTAIKSELSNYVKSKGGDPWGQVTLIGNPITNPSNIYKFKFNVSIPSLNKTVEVDITTTRYNDYLYFSVPADNYQAQIGL